MTIATVFSLLFLVALIAGIVLTVQALRRRQKMPRNAKIAFGVMAASLVLFGLTMSPEERQAAQPQASETGTVNPQNSEATNTDGCIKVSPEMVKAILNGAPASALTNVWAAKAPDRQNTYFIAGDFVNSRVFDNDPHIAVWASSSLTPGEGMLQSVNSFALQGSQWGDGPKSQAELSVGEEGARLASVCVDQNRH